jgi:hypothetical protein
VLFGGQNFITQMNDTWEFDGTDWSQLKPSHSPPLTVNPELVYDRARHRLTMLGETGMWVYLP